MKYINYDLNPIHTAAVYYKKFTFTDVTVTYIHSSSLSLTSRLRFFPTNVYKFHVKCSLVDSI